MKEPENHGGPSGTYWEHIRNISGTNQEHIRNKSGTYQEHIENISGTNQEQIRNKSGTHQEHIGNISGTWIRTFNKNYSSKQLQKAGLQTCDKRLENVPLFLPEQDQERRNVWRTFFSPTNHSCLGAELSPGCWSVLSRAETWRTRPLGSLSIIQWPRPQTPAASELTNGS